LNNSNIKYICTYFDSNFLPRGLALYESIKKNAQEFILYILALDKTTFDYLQALRDEKIIPISIREYNNFFSIDIQKFTDKKQFYFSLTPKLCIYLLKNYPHIDILLYLDADVYIFNSLDILYDEIGSAAITMCPHRINPIINFFSHHYGSYNVGVNSFRNNEEALNCLNEWKNEIDSWYPKKAGYPLSFLSDQIFLDTWPNKFPNLKIIKHIGINAAPWNCINYRFRKKDRIYYVNNKPLVIYHFSSLRKIEKNVWDANNDQTIVNIKGTLLEIYMNYIKEIDSSNITSNETVKLNVQGSILKKIIYRLLKIFTNDKIIFPSNKN